MAKKSVNKPKSRELTPKQQRFVHEYLIDLNATEAAKRAGYSEKTAMEQGYKLVHKVSVVAAINEAKQDRECRTNITQDKVLKETARLAFSSIGELFSPDDFELVPPTQLPDDVARAIASVKKKRESLRLATRSLPGSISFGIKTRHLINFIGI